MKLASILAVYLVFGSAQVPSVRSAQTGAVCLGEYAWMSNSKGDSPCLLAAVVDGACDGGNWQIPALDGQDRYDSPGTNNTPVNLCTCSWTEYNLLNACATCQGYQNTIQGWGPYKISCTAATLSNTYFPNSQIPLPDGTAIPAWAAIDPSQWPSETFSTTQAQQIAGEGKPDLVFGTSTSSSSSQTSSTPVGAIAGGVVGGVAALLLAGGLAFYMIHRKRKQQNYNAILANDYTNAHSRPGHGRAMSDYSQKSTTVGGSIGYSSFGNFLPVKSPMSPTMYTHSGSAHSLSYFGSAAGSTAYPASSVGRPVSPRSMSPSLPPINLNQENIIVPYMVPQSHTQGTTRQTSDRKRADGAHAYDQPTTPPVQVEGPVTSRRPRFNPPEYTPYTGPEPGPGPDDSSSQIHAPSAAARPARPVLTKSNSTDTQHSWDSSGHTSGVREGHGAGAPTLCNVVEQMDFDPLGYELESNLRSDGTIATALSGVSM